MIRFSPFLIFLSLSFSLSAGNGYVFLKDTSKLFYVRNNEIYSPDGKQLLYFQKGNIFFTGGSDDKKNIFLLTTSMDPAATKLQLIYEDQSRKPVYSFRDNKFYTGRTESEDLRDKTELLRIEKLKKWLAFYASVNDSLLAYYPSDSLPSATAIIVAYTLIIRFELEKKSGVLQGKPPFENKAFATLKPAWGNTTANEWMWDGKVLRPRWNTDQRLMWTFDGQTIKPFYGINTNEEYSWDGENFKPVWRTNRAQEWSWDGRIMKPIWDTDWANQYKIEDGVIEPWSNVHTERQWNLDGDIPIPLIILVISGIARTY